jgi:DNA-binding CsgD family transcriptional regulator
LEAEVVKGRPERGRRESEDPAWEYLAQVPQDPEYPFHSLRWERLVANEELPLLEECLAPVEAPLEAPDVLRLAERLAREAKLCERECAVLRRRVAGMSQGETARALALRKATVGVIWKEVRAKLAEVMAETS